MTTANKILCTGNGFTPFGWIGMSGRWYPDLAECENSEGLRENRVIGGFAASLQDAADHRREIIEYRKSKH